MNDQQRRDWGYSIWCKKCDAEPVKKGSLFFCEDCLDEEE